MYCCIWPKRGGYQLIDCGFVLCISPRLNLLIIAKRDNYPSPVVGSLSLCMLGETGGLGIGPQDQWGHTDRLMWPGGCRPSLNVCQMNSSWGYFWLLVLFMRLFPALGWLIISKCPHKQKPRGSEQGGLVRDTCKSALCFREHILAEILTQMVNSFRVTEKCWLQRESGSEGVPRSKSYSRAGSSFRYCCT